MKEHTFTILIGTVLALVLVFSMVIALKVVENQELLKQLLEI